LRFFTATSPKLQAVDLRTGRLSKAELAISKPGPIAPPSREPIVQLSEIIGEPGVEEITRPEPLDFTPLATRSSENV
jgi:hypothetical protein